MTTAWPQPPLLRRTPAVDRTVPEEGREPEDDDTAPVGGGRATGAASPQEAEVVARVWARRECLGGTYRLDQMNQEKEKWNTGGLRAKAKGEERAR